MAQTTAQGRSGKVTWQTLGVAACLLIGAILRLYRLDAQSLWSDEGIQYAVANAESFGGVIERMKGSTMHPPLSFLINHLFLQIRNSDFLLRLPSALFGIASLPLLYLLARRLTTPAAALFALFVLALSPFHIWYSQEARMYAGVLFAALLNTLFLLKAVERGRWWWLGYIASMAFGVFLHVFMVFNGGIHILWLLCFHRRHLVVYIASGVAAALLAFPITLPWAQHAARLLTSSKPVGVASSSIDVGHRAGMSWEALPYTFFTYGAGVSLGPSTASLHAKRNMGHVLSFWPSLLATALVYGALLAMGVWAFRQHAPPAHLWLCVLSLLLPMAAVALVALAVKFSYNVRYTIYGFPYFIILAGMGGAAWARRRAWVTALAALAVVGLSAYSLTNYFNNPYYAKEDLRAAAAQWRQAPPSTYLLICTPAGGVARVVRRYSSAEEQARAILLGKRDLAAKTRDFFAEHAVDSAYMLFARDWRRQLEKSVRTEFKLQEVQAYPGGVRLMQVWR